MIKCHKCNRDFPLQKIQVPEFIDRWLCDECLELYIIKYGEFLQTFFEKPVNLCDEFGHFFICLLNDQSICNRCGFVHGSYDEKKV